MGDTIKVLIVSRSGASLKAGPERCVRAKRGASEGAKRKRSLPPLSEAKRSGACRPVVWR